MQKFTVPIPLSLYIHIPWCVRKCPYCDFNSHEVRDNLAEEIYIKALEKDIDEQLPKIWGRRLTSIFFGGGTPSLFSPQAIEKIVTMVHTRLPFGPDIEMTLEANPGTVDQERFYGFHQAGINRLSLGIQSLQDEKLKALGRIHHREHALRAIEAAQTAGFENMNLDLMHGLPNQSLADAINDLKDALQFKTPHLSWYQLTIEPNTFFHYQPPTLPIEETLWNIQEQGKRLITQHLQQYEVSAYSQPGYECVHNQNYWEFGDYLGIGAGAHSKITDMDQQVVTRHWQVKNPKDYLDLNKKFTANQSILTTQDLIFEFMLNALRLTNGVAIDLFTERTGLPIEIIEPMINAAKNKKLLMNNDKRLQPTELGQRFLNDLMAMFLITS